MKTKFISSLNNGRLQIRELTFWKALGISFLFDIILSTVRLPTDVFNIAFSGEIFRLPLWILDSINEIISCLYQYGAILIIIIFINRKITLSQEYNTFKPTKKEYLGGAILIISYILITYGWFDYILFSLPTVDDGVYEYLYEFINNTPWLIIFIETCIMAPIFEEILYRGILLNGLLKKYNAKKAIIYSSLIFGIVHLNLPQGINAFFLALIIGMVYYYTRSIYVCMFMHFVNNFLVDYIYYPETQLWTIILFILIPIVGLLMMVSTWKWLDLKRKSYK